MKKLLFPVIACALALGAGAKAPKDPVLMTVDGQPVTLSEFEYLFHKNSDQQLEKESKEEYLQRFIDYKLKVAQARHERQDTTASYKKDFQQYRLELALPYLRDTVMERKILEDSYAHTLENVNIDHIMLSLERKDLADSLHRVLTAGTGDFFALAKQHSIDPSMKQNGGHYGWITAGVYPYSFEEAAYDTPVGKISDVVKTDYGYHIIRVNERRPDAGEIHAAHILVKLDQGDDSVAAKARIDSIYNELKNGARFDLLARKVSDCPSKAQGGDLDWFGRGRMVPEFEDVAFALQPGEISEPVRSRFGWHIIQKIAERRATKRDAINELRGAIARDERSVRPRLSKAEQLKKLYNTHIDEKGRDELLASVTKLGYDSTRTLMMDSPVALFHVGDSTITIGDFMKQNYRMLPRVPQTEQVMEKVNDRMTSATLVYENHRLEQKYPEFRNVSREYSEGLMLFASMEKNVWNAPTDNPEGLKAYFEKNREKYAFSEPRWKGFIIYATNDSLMNAVSDYIESHKPAPEALGDLLKVNFPRNIRIERVVLPEHENEIVDYVGFNGPEPKRSGRWVNYITYLGHVITAPEEVADVRGKVTNDYVAELEEQWIKTLRERYPVKVDKKVFKKVK